MIDNTDKAIIDILMSDWRIRKETIAAKLNKSPSSIRRRIKILEEDGILNFVAVPNPVKLGYSFRTMLTFNVVHAHMSKVLKELASRPEIKWLAATTGRYDILAIGWFSSADKLYSFMDKTISKIEGIKSSETFVCLYVQKELDHQFPTSYRPQSHKYA